MPGGLGILNKNVKQRQQLQILKLHGMTAIHADDPVLTIVEPVTVASWAVQCPGPNHA